MGFPSIYKSGDKYALLTLTGKAFFRKSGKCNRTVVEAICDCGNLIYSFFTAIKSGATKSCGCKKRDHLISIGRTHGMSWGENKHPIYQAWQAMKSRCIDPANSAYHNYGGRGILVCDEWMDDYPSFYNWAIHNGWQEGLELDRYPNNETGNYEPSNCRWANEYQQSRNKRNNNFISAFGETKCITDWIRDERCVVGYGTVFYRLNVLKWSLEMAITEPPKYSTKWREKQLLIQPT